MAKDRRKLQHIHSSIADKQPTAASLEVGEIAVNNAKDQEFLSIKNSNNQVVRFSTDEQIVSLMEKKTVIPYEGYTRGSDGPTGSTGPNSVTESDLQQNKSNIIIKFNQVVAGKTAKHNAVNGAKDIYNNDVNPTSDSGVTDGAGFAIDMSRYAMIGANPSFSSMTASCGTTLKGTTKIIGGSSACGSELDVNTSLVNVTATTLNETISACNEGIRNRVTNVGTERLVVSGTTNETHTGNVTIVNESGLTVNTSGSTVESSVSGHSINTSENFNVRAGENVCINANEDVKIYGKENTYIGQSCNGDTTPSMYVQGKETYIVSTTYDLDLEASNTSAYLRANNDINLHARQNICATAGTTASIVGTTNTNIGINCNGAISGDTTNIYGTTLNENAGTINTSATTINVKGTTSNSQFTNYNTTASTENHNTTSYTLTSSATCLSATDTISIGGDKTSIGTNCTGGGISNTTNIYGRTINQSGTTYNVTGNTNINGNTTITGTLDASGGMSKKLSWSYENVCNASNGETNFSSDKTVKIPSSVGHLKRETLRWSYGDARSASGGTYDPGQNSTTACTAEIGFTIPNSIDNLTNWNGTCIELPHDVCVSGKVTSSGGFFQSSDRNLKENIEAPNFSKVMAANKTPIAKFNYKTDDDKRDSYGVIAQEVEANGLNELVFTDENGNKAVDYISLMILKIAYLENEVILLRDKITSLEENAK